MLNLGENKGNKTRNLTLSPREKFMNRSVDAYEYEISLGVLSAKLIPCTPPGVLKFGVGREGGDRLESHDLLPLKHGLI